MQTFPSLSQTTQVACPPGHASDEETVLHPSSSRIATSPFWVTTQILACSSSQTDLTVSNGSPASFPCNSTTCNRTRFNPPPSVPTQMLPSRSSLIIRMRPCDVSTLEMFVPWNRNNPLAGVPIHSAPALSSHRVLVR